jgi:hypothetical protein
VSPRFLPLALVLALVAAPLGAQHRPGAHSGGRPRASHPRSYSSRPKPPSASPRAQREHRSQAAKHEFMRRSGHPHGWPGMWWITSCRSPAAGPTSRGTCSEAGGKLLPIEVKASARPRLADAAHLRIFRKEYGRKARSGLLLHTGTALEWLAPDVLAAPWWMVL